MRAVPIILITLLTVGLSSLFAVEEPAAAVGSVAGKVVDPAGQPARDCLVTLQIAGQKMRTDPLQTTTDDDGKFKLEKVPEGAYNLNVRSRDTKFKAVKSLKVVGDKSTDVGILKLKAK